MSTIVRHPNRHVRSGTAALAALVRWYPDATMLSVRLLRNRWPGFPLITGGSPRQPAIDWTPGPEHDGAGRACA